MDADSRIRLLAEAAADETCDECTRAGMPPREEFREGVYVARGPGGRAVPLLKILQSSYCERDCGYCAFRKGRDVRRAVLRPEELASGFEGLLRAGRVTGLFLSSGEYAAGGGNAARTAMDRMLATAELVRRRGWRGYVHLKVLPGADDDQVERAAALASRLSVNLEAPTVDALARVAPHKAFREELLARVDRVARVVAARRGRAVSWSTQFVVGAAGETDRELLGTADRLYRDRGLGRAYYSRFRPVPDTPLEDVPETPALRQVRLYQADWLLRFYGFALRELPFLAGGGLPQDADPKSAWAGAHPEAFPIEVNRADPAMLLRVPGLGPLGVRRIVDARVRGALRSPRDLAAIGVRTRRALAWLTIDGRSFAGSARGTTDEHR